MNLFILYLHKMLYVILKPIFKLIRKHEFVFTNFVPKISGNAIYAVNHSNRYDIPYTCELLSRQCYVLLGNQPLKPIDRLAFILNGAVWVDRKSREDRNNSKAKMIKLLHNKTNLVIFPEGTWNLTPSKPMLPLYWGVIDIARFSCKPIIPMVLEYTDKKCYVAFGESMTIYPNDKKGDKIGVLNDQFSTLKWTIWEKFPDTGCNTLDEWNAEVKKRLSEYLKLDYKYETSVIRKEYDVAEDVFGHLNELTPGRNNAFLFNKRNHY